MTEVFAAAASLLASYAEALGPLGGASLALASALMALHLTSLALAFAETRRAPTPPTTAQTQPVTVVRVLCGVEPTTPATLLGTLAFEYPDVRPIFCVARADDPVAPYVRRAMAVRPEAGARFLIGEDRVGANPKLNNMQKAWRAADTDLVLFLDSNLDAPSDYVARAVAALGQDAAAVSAPPLGLSPENFAAEIEAAFLNTHAARWQYAAHGLGLGFAQGKTLLLARSRLPLGDLSALAREPAEDAALTRLARAAGRDVALLAPPAGQRLGRRALSEVWSRQLRWARLRRAVFPGLYALELAAGAIPAIAAAATAGAALGLVWLAPAFAMLWWGAEIAFARLRGWPAAPAALVARDLALPALWLAGWRGGAVTWRGAAIPLAETGPPGSRPGVAAHAP